MASYVHFGWCCLAKFCEKSWVLGGFNRGVLDEESCRAKANKLSGSTKERNSAIRTKVHLKQVSGHRSQCVGKNEATVIGNFESNRCKKLSHNHMIAGDTRGLMRRHIRWHFEIRYIIIHQSTLLLQKQRGLQST